MVARRLPYSVKQILVLARRTVVDELNRQLSKTPSNRNKEPAKRRRESRLSVDDEP